MISQNFNSAGKLQQKLQIWSNQVKQFSTEKNLQSEKATYRIQEMCYYSSDTGLKYKMHRELKE